MNIWAASENPSSTPGSVGSEDRAPEAARRVSWVDTASGPQAPLGTAGGWGITSVDQWDSVWAVCLYLCSWGAGAASLGHCCGFTWDNSAQGVWVVLGR